VTVRGINVGPVDGARARAGELTEKAKTHAASGPEWMMGEDDGSVRSPVAKFLSRQAIAEIRARLDASTRDVLLVVADRWRTVVDTLGALRTELGRPQSHEDLAFLWVIDFPMFEEEEDGSITFSHHPFTSPVSIDAMRENPKSAVAKAY